MYQIGGGISCYLRHFCKSCTGQHHWSSGHLDVLFINASHVLFLCSLPSDIGVACLFITAHMSLPVNSLSRLLLSLERQSTPCLTTDGAPSRVVFI